MGNVKLFGTFRCSYLRGMRSCNRTTMTTNKQQQSARKPPTPNINKVILSAGFLSHNVAGCGCFTGLSDVELIFGADVTPGAWVGVPAGAWVGMPAGAWVGVPAGDGAEVGVPSLDKIATALGPAMVPTFSIFNAHEFVWFTFALLLLPVMTVLLDVHFGHNSLSALMFCVWSPL